MLSAIIIMKALYDGRLVYFIEGDERHVKGSIPPVR